MTKQLNRITFTGIDEYANKSDIVNLSREFPIVEFGLLTAKNWKENSTRYPNPEIMHDLYAPNVNYSLHLCGRFARKALINDYTDVYQELSDTLKYYSRLQINVSNMTDKPTYHTEPPHENIKQIIVQTPNNERMDLYNHLALNSDKCVPLFDMSGGRGLYQPTTLESFNFNAPYYGIAGGIDKHNCQQVVNNILVFDTQQRPFWIDMESGIRDENDKFSIEKCYDVCKALQPYMTK